MIFSVPTMCGSAAGKLPLINFHLGVIKMKCSVSLDIGNVFFLKTFFFLLFFFFLSFFSPKTLEKECLWRPVVIILSSSWAGKSSRKAVKISLVVQWLRLRAPNAGVQGLIPAQGTRSHEPQLRVSMLQLKDLNCCHLNLVGAAKEIFFF